MKSPAIQTPDQAIRMYSAIEALKNQFKAENQNRKRCGVCGAPIKTNDTSCENCNSTDLEN